MTANEQYYRDHGETAPKLDENAQKLDDQLKEQSPSIPPQAADSDNEDFDDFDDFSDFDLELLSAPINWVSPGVQRGPSGSYISEYFKDQSIFATVGPNGPMQIGYNFDLIIGAARRGFTTLDNELTQLASVVAGLQNSNQDRFNENVRALNAISGVQNDVKKLYQYNADRSNENLQQTNRINTLESYNSQRASEIRGMTGDIASLQASNKDRFNENIAQTSRLNALESYNAERAGEIRSITGDIAGLRTSNTERFNENVAQTARLNALEAYNADRSKENVEQTARINALESYNAERAGEIKNIVNTVTGLQQSNADRSKENVDQTKRINALEAYNTDRANEIKGVVGDVSVLKSANTDRFKEVQTLSSKVDKLSDEVEFLATGGSSGSSIFDDTAIIAAIALASKNVSDLWNADDYSSSSIGEKDGKAVRLFKNQFKKLNDTIKSSSESSASSDKAYWEKFYEKDGPAQNLYSNRSNGTKLDLVLGGLTLLTSKAQGIIDAIEKQNGGSIFDPAAIIAAIALSSKNISDLWNADDYTSSTVGEKDGKAVQLFKGQFKMLADTIKSSGTGSFPDQSYWDKLLFQANYLGMTYSWIIQFDRRLVQMNINLDNLISNGKQILDAVKNQSGGSVFDPAAIIAAIALSSKNISDLWNADDYGTSAVGENDGKAVRLIKNQFKILADIIKGISDKTYWEKFLDRFYSQGGTSSDIYGIMSWVRQSDGKLDLVINRVVTSANSIIDAIKSQKLEFPSVGGGSFWDALETLIKTLGSVIEKAIGEVGKNLLALIDILKDLTNAVIRLLIPENLDFLNKKFSGLNKKFEVKFGGILNLGNQIKNVFTPNKKDFFKAISFEFMGAKFAPTSEITDTFVPTFRMAMAVLIWLYVAWFAYEKVTGKGDLINDN